MPGPGFNLDHVVIGTKGIFTTGKSFAVKPVVLYPGWFVEQRPGSKRDVWVLNEKAFPKFLANEANFRCRWRCSVTVRTEE